jgi:serine/threonine protein kinase/predicted Zn-dependent protease
VPIAAGTRLGRYEIRSLLGTGGMGEVYLGYDTSLRRQVAIKLLPAEFTQNKVRLARFEREAYAASSLNHPNILTIYEIGEQDGNHFIATEYVEGESLRHHLSRKHIELREVLDVTSQVASALAAAHEAGIVHRDIKPENIMLRRDGLIKVLDFGLAKLADDADSGARQEGIETEAPTKTRVVNTEPGMVMGTASYMSPEQARGLEVDARSDIWSLGVMLYEMVSGRLPFEGTTTSDVIATILHRQPPSLLLYRSDVPAELERIVEKALTKEREERYQLAKDLGLDLKRLKQRLEVEAELERTITPEEEAKHISSRPATGSGGAITSGATAPAAARATAGASTVQTTSSAEYLISEIKRHKRGFGLTVGVLVIVAAVTIFFYFHRASALTEKDTILIADFINTTGDAVFDGTLKQGLAVQLTQSPFLNLFPDARVRQTLRLMGRSPDDRVTKEVAREICQRQGLKAFLSGSITNLGSSYVITLEAVNGQSGEEIASEQAEAGSKEQVLKALSQAASKLREKLGESLGSIQKFDAPLEEATTSSLEALKAYSLGNEQSISGKWLQAIPFYKRAVELDPNFALAYIGMAIQYGNTNQPGLAAENAAKAFALKDRVSEYEKLRISSFYYSQVTGEIDKAIEVQELMKRTYPRDHRGPGNLSDRYLRIGQFERAVPEAREALRLNPNAVAWHANLGEAFLRLNRFAESREVFEQALQQKIDATDFHTRLYQLAFVNGDTTAMKQQLDWSNGKPDEYVALDWQTQTSAFAGHYKLAQEFSRRSIDLAVRSDAKEVAVQFAAEEALRSAAFGQCQQTKADAAQALTLEHNIVSLTRSSIALALCGEVGQAQSLVDELTKRYPKDTLINSIWLPVIRAAIEINRNNPAQAVELLEATRRYEAAAEFWPQYLRGQAYLRQQKGAEAAVEFQKILDHRGEAPLSALYPLAHLGLARAAAMAGDTMKARTAYQNFLAVWKDADPEITILLEAKREYDKLK